MIDDIKEDGPKYEYENHKKAYVMLFDLFVPLEIVIL